MPGNWCALSSQQPLMDFGYSTWFSVTMTIRKHGKTLHLLLMMAIFLYALGKSVSKWRDKKVGVTYGTKSADKMFYPSVTLVPLFEPSYAISRISNLSSFGQEHLQVEREKGGRDANIQERLADGLPFRDHDTLL